MSEMNFVNLDEMVPDVEKFVLWKKVKHPIREMTVGNFKKALNIQKQFEALTEDSDQGDVVETYVSMCSIVLPSIPEEDVRGWSVSMMMKVIQLILFVATEEAPEMEEVAESLGKPPEEEKAE